MPYFLTIVFAALVLASPAEARYTDLDRTPHRPDIVRALDGNADTDVAYRCRSYSDIHVYTAGGRATRQVPTPQGWAFYLRGSNRVVAAIDRLPKGRCIAYGLTRRPLILALWRG